MNLIEKIQKSAEGTYNSEIGAKHEILFSVIEFLAEKMNSLGINKKQLADRLRMKSSQLSRIFNAEENMTASTIGRIYWTFKERPFVSSWSHATCVEDITGKNISKSAGSGEVSIIVGESALPTVMAITGKY